MSETVVLEHWKRQIALKFARKLPENLQGEALQHANWFRNRLPARLIKGKVPILSWYFNIVIDFRSLSSFGQTEFVVIYLSNTEIRRKLKPRSGFSHFAGMNSDTIPFRAYMPKSKMAKAVKRGDFTFTGEG